MARIEPIATRQIETLAAQIEAQLGAAVDIPGVSSLTLPVDALIDVDRWRKAVRLVARPSRLEGTNRRQPGRGLGDGHA